MLVELTLRDVIHTARPAKTSPLAKNYPERSLEEKRARCHRRRPTDRQAEQCTTANNKNQTEPKETSGSPFEIKNFP
jgi:hypothetical protein